MVEPQGHASKMSLITHPMGIYSATLERIEVVMGCSMHGIFSPRGLLGVLFRRTGAEIGFHIVRLSVISATP